MNKKRLFVGLLVLAIMFTLVLGVVACKPTPDEPTFTPQGEEAVYYCMGETRENTIELKKGQFVLSIEGGSPQTGEYTFDKTKGEVVLSLSDTVVIQARLNLEKGEMEFRYNQVSYVMIKKVNFTVTFNSNGGSDVASQSVLNGMLATQPQAPTKSGAVFTGWYKDAGLTQSFNFKSDKITANTTLYAKYIETSESDYNFDVQLINGDQVVETKKTVGGYVLDLPELTETGKTFLGWWFSDSNNAQRLTRPYTSEQQIYENTALYAVWAEDYEIIVSYENGKATWESINASRYTYTLTKLTESGIQYVFSNATGGTSFDINFEELELEPGEYQITVDGDQKSGAAYFTYKVLNKVSLFKVDGNDLIFNKVPNATDYLITVICGDQSHEHVLESLNGAVAYNFANCQIAKDGYKFTVTAVADGYVSSVSETYTYNRSLAEIKNVNRDLATEVITWDAVEGATSYLVKITAGGQTEEKTVYTNSFFAGNYRGEITIEVTPVAFGYNATSNNISYTNNKLLAPSNIKVNGDVISWDAVEGATGYIVKIGDKEYSVSSNSLTMGDGYYVDGQVEYVISIKAQASNPADNSIYSEAFTAKYGVMGNIAYENNRLTWDAVFGAVKYVVVINAGTETERTITVDDGSLFAVITWSKAGENEVKVYSVDKNDVASTAVSTKVTTYEIVFETNDQAQVDSIFVAVGDEYTLPTPTAYGLDFNGWYDRADVNNGVLVNTTGVLTKAEGFTVYASWTKQKFTVTLDLGETGQLPEGTELTHKVTYDESFDLPVPTSTDTSVVFIGWYELPNGEGLKYTDQTGASVSKFPANSDKTLYPRWETILQFTPEFNPVTNKYDIVSVKATQAMRYVTEVTIPMTYTGELTYKETYEDEDGNTQTQTVTEHKTWRVVTVGPSAFLDQKTITVIRIPSTIETISWGGNKGSYYAPSAFAGCSSLEAVVIYDATDPSREMDMENAYKYWSQDGVLFINDPTSMQVEIVCYPANKTNTSYNIPYGVTSIPQYTFNNTALASVTIPCSVATIGSSAFSSNRYLTTIEFIDALDGQIPAVTLELAEGDGYHAAIYDCVQLEYIRFPLRLAKFSEAAIIGCSRLSTVIIGKDGEKGDVYMSEAFYKTNEDGSKTIVGSVIMDRARTTLLFVPRGYMGEEIYDDEGVYQGTAIRVPQGVETIAKYAFGAPTADRTTRANIVYIPASVTLVEQGAFANCGYLQKVVFEGEVEHADLTIQTEAFLNCTGLRELYLPENLTNLEVYAFGGTSSLDVVYVNANRPVVNYEARAFATKSYNIESSVYYVRVLHIGAYVPEINFAEVFGISNLESVHIDPASNFYYSDADGVVFNKAVTKLMFFPKGKTGSYTIPNTVQIINAYVFRDADKLREVTIPNSVQTISNYAFQNCDALITVNFVTGGTMPLYIGNSAFAGCKLLDDIVIVQRVAQISPRAFYECSSLKSLTFEARATQRTLSIGALAFADTDITGDITLPNGTTRIENMAFMNCANLKNVNLPATLTKMGAYTTREVSDVATGTVVKRDILYDMSVFAGCTSLENINVASANRVYASINGVLFSKEHIQLRVNYSEYEYSYNPDDTYNYHDTNQFDIIDTNFYSNADGTIKVLLLCPVKNAGSNGELEIPNTTMALWYSAFRGNVGLTDVYFSDVQLDNDWNNGIYIGNKAFYDCSTIQYITLPRGLTAISTQLFYNCSSLKEIYIPNTVTTIEQEAFYNCASLNEINFEDATNDSNYPLVLADCFANTSIFTGCVNLKEIKLPQRTTVIGQYALSIGSFTKVTLPASLTEIRPQAFYYNTNLQQVSFVGDLDGELVIYEYAFYGASSLTSIVIPEGTTHVGYYALANCSNITSLAFPSTLVDLGGYYANAELGLSGYACYSMANLQTVTFADGIQLQSIPQSTFERCSNLLEIKIPFSVVSIGQRAFSNATKLSKVEIEHKNGVSNLNTIGNYAFEYTAIQSFVFPTSSTSSPLYLGAALFRGCVDLEYVYFSKNVQSVSNLFRDCFSIKTIEVAEDNEYFRAHEPKEGEEKLPLLTDAAGTTVKLAYGTMPAQLVIPDYITVIGTYAFLSQSSLKVIVLPATLTTIEPFAFAYATGLQEVRFAEGDVKLTGIGQSAFLATLSLETFNIPTNVNNFTIGQQAFSGSGIQYITIPSNVSAIYSKAFESTFNLREITIPSGSSLTIAGFAFMNSGVKTITFAGRVPSLANSVFSYAVNLETVVFAEDSVLAKLPARMFQYCYNLKNVDLSPLTNIKAISAYCFASTGLEEFALPATVKNLNSDGSENTSIQYIAQSVNAQFENCENLKTFYINEDMKVLAGYIFKNCISLTTLTYKKPAEGEQPEEGMFLPDGLIYWGGDMTGTKIKKLHIGEETSALATMGNPTGGFLFMSELEEIHFGENTTLAQLPASFAKDCTKLKKVNLENLKALATIKASLFANTAIESIIIPEKVTYLASTASVRVTSGSSIFANCTNLKSVELGNVVKIGTSTFENCTSLTTVTAKYGQVKDGISELQIIGTYAFKNTGLTKVQMGKYLKSGTSYSADTVGEQAFADCKNLQEVVIESGERTILGNMSGQKDKVITDKAQANFLKASPSDGYKSGLFKNCTSLSKVTIPNNITTVGAFTFYGCTSLTDISFLNKSKGQLTYIHNSAFEGSGITSVDFSGYNKLKLINYAAFKDCTDLVDVKLPTQSSETFEITEQAFYGCAQMQSINLHETKITAVPAYAFTNCASLKAIRFGSSVGTLGQYAFQNCTSLTTADMSQALGIVTISQYAYEGCIRLETVKIPNDVTTIELWAFANCRALDDLEFPSKLEKINNYAFINCTSLSKIDFSNSTLLMTIGMAAFKDCTSVTEIIYPQPCTIAAIQAQTFEGLTSLQTIELPNSITTLHDRAFYGATAITSFVIPDGIKNIGMGAFGGMTNLKTFTVSGGNTSYKVGDQGELIRNHTQGTQLVAVPGGFEGEFVVDFTKYSLTSQPLYYGPFAGCDKITTLVLPEGLTRINEYMFAYSMFETIVLPSTVEEIAWNAFENSGATNIILNEGLKMIGEYAFAKTPNLKSLIIPSTVEMIGMWCLNQSAIEELYFNAIAAEGCLEQYDTWGESAWVREAPNFKKLVVGQGVTMIDFWMFEEMHNMTIDVTLPSSLKEFNHLANSCTNVVFNVHMPEGIEAIGSDTIYNYGLDTTYGRKYDSKTQASTGIVSHKGDYVRYGFFKGVRVSGSAVKVNPVALEDESLYNVLNVEKWPTSLNRVGADAFTFTKFTNFDMSGTNLDSIATGAFKYSIADEIKLPNTLRTLGSDVFLGSHIGKITMPSSIVAIGEFDTKAQVYRDNTFTFATIGEVVYAEGFVKLHPGTNEAYAENESAYAGATVGKIVLPQSLVEISAYLFADLGYTTPMEYLVLPSNVEIIGADAFAFARIKSLYVNCVIAELKYETEGKYAITTEGVKDDTQESEYNVGTFAGWLDDQTIYVSTSQAKFILAANFALSYIDKATSATFVGNTLVRCVGDCRAIVVYDFDPAKIPA